MNMSKVITSDKQDACKPWQAPSFGAGATTNGAAGLRTHEQNAQLKKQAYDEGFTQGLNDGKQQLQQQMQDKLARLDAILAFMSTPLKELDERVVNELGELAMLVAGQIVRRELKSSSGEIIATVKDALNLLPVASGKVRLELHPEDAATIRDALSDGDAEKSWDIIEDPLLARGGCRVSTSSSRIDATVESRLNAAIAAVMGCERKEEQ